VSSSAQFIVLKPLVVRISTYNVSVCVCVDSCFQASIVSKLFLQTASGLAHGFSIGFLLSSILQLNLGYYIFLNT